MKLFILVAFDLAAFNTAASSLKKILKDKMTAVTVSLIVLMSI